MKVFAAADTNPMSWEEYGGAVQALLAKIRNRNRMFDAIAPILRSGGIPGAVVAINLKITRIIPLQFKYAHQPVKLVQMLPIPTLPQGMPESPNILICENNTSSGDTARAAIALLKKDFPTCKLWYATVARVFGCPDAFDGVEEILFGIQTDERFSATPEETAQLGLRPGITIFPW